MTTGYLQDVEAFPDEKDVDVDVNAFDSSEDLNSIDAIAPLLAEDHGHDIKV